ncbi:ferritin-like domain-containing protein [Ensifer aridi]|uniref:ferritin-like domain-containing protein n=1 Tax=Ensifer aridi TaxID=1708715 RepID=UPI00358F6DD7
MSGELQKQKIFPRNQTAHSDAIVRGNPVTTRPDDAVENTFPGLEFDHRNFEKKFFPGLTFELHHTARGMASAWLRFVDPALGYPIDEADRAAGLTLWHVVGNFPEIGGSGRVVRSQMTLFGRSGPQVWQILRELEAGAVAIVLGPRRSIGEAVPTTIDEQVQSALGGGKNASIPFGTSHVVVLFGQRVDYLPKGIINPELFEPGDLTRSLCAPWQYDFTDCGCWYWASNKPDMVAVSDGGPQIFNFQRLRTGADAPEPPTHPPVVSNTEWEEGRTKDSAGIPLSAVERVPRQMNHAELINGWEILPVVINDTETTKYVHAPSEDFPDDQLLPDKAAIVQRLEYLAGIEHALMVEYLYAHYSINAPRARPDLGDTTALRRYEAANTILSVAIDEMRHFRWVNEILVLLGSPPVVARAEKTVDLDNDSRFLEHTFGLLPATQERVDWFIDVEKPSRDVDPDLKPDTIDGMYTRLLFSIERSADITGEVKARVLHLIKLIIDEGYDHYHRFLRARQLLPQAPDVSYLRLPANPAPLPATNPAKEFELRVNRSYEVILNLLLIVFGRGDAEHGQLIEATRIAMVDSMDMETLALIANGGAPLFTVPLITQERNLGRFQIARQTALADKLVVLDAAPPASASDTVAEATKALDELNQTHASTGNSALQALAARSASAMQRVREAFTAVMISSGS